MDFSDVLEKRRSCHFYRSKPVEFDLIGTVLYAGTQAPSAGNVQNWEFIVVTDQGKREQVAKACIDQTWMVNAPVHLVICNNKERVTKLYPRRGALYATQNCALAAGNMMLRATELGLGTCWVGSFDETAVKRILRIPSSVEPELILTLGYVQELDQPTSREPLSVVTHFETYGKRNREGDVGVFPLVPRVERTVEEAKATVTDLHDQSKKGLSRFFGWLKKKKDGGSESPPTSS